MHNIITISNLEHHYHEKTVLQNINLEISEGEIFGLLGPSGAGKTTLIKILTGKLLPTGGATTILGKNPASLTGNDYCKIGIMMDNFGLYERLTCYDNLKLFAGIYHLPAERIAESLDEVGLSDAKKTSVLHLSKGMRSRLLLARALMHKPDILFLDEPTSGLDPKTTEEIHQLIYRERDRGMTIFLTTHNMFEAEKICDHVALLDNGHILEYGSPKEICRQYNHQKKFLLHLTDGSDITLPHDKSAGSKIAMYLEKEELVTIRSTEPNLETVFMELTGRRFE